MFHESPIEALESIKRNIEMDIAWYQKPNGPGVNFSAEYRKGCIAELTGYLAQYTKAIAVLKAELLEADSGRICSICQDNPCACLA